MMEALDKLSKFLWEPIQVPGDQPEDFSKGIVIETRVLVDGQVVDSLKQRRDGSVQAGVQWTRQVLHKLDN